MTDLEIVKKCAEKMGLKPDGQATKSVAYNVSHCSILAINEKGGHTVYDPLHNDAQAMALLYLLMLDGEVIIDCNGFRFNSEEHGIEAVYSVESKKDLNRAICKCVARLP